MTQFELFQNSNLTIKDNNGEDKTVKLMLYIETTTGRVGMTASSYENLTGVHHTTIKRRIEKASQMIGGANLTSYEAEMQTVGGFQRGHIIWEEVIQEYIVDDAPELAKAMLRAGLRVFLYQVCGYTVKVEKPDYTELQLEVDKAQKELDKTAIETFKFMLAQAKADGDERMAHFYQTALAQYSQAKLLNGAGAVTALPEKKFEGVVDVAIRKGWRVPKNLEGSLGKYVKARLGHLLVVVSFDANGKPVHRTDNRFSQASDKTVSALMYPYGNAEVERCVEEYLRGKGVI